MEINDKEELMKWLAFAPTKVFDILKSIGFNDVGSVINYLERYEK